MRRKGKIINKMPKQVRLTITSLDKNDLDTILRFKEYCKKKKLIHSQVVISLIREYLLSTIIKGELDDREQSNLNRNY